MGFGTWVLLGVGFEDLFGGSLEGFGAFGIEVLPEVVLDAELMVGPHFVNLVGAGLGYRQVDTSPIFC